MIMHPIQEQVDKTKQKAEKIGHCLCSLDFKCPCLVYKEMGICKCAGDITIDFQDWININNNKNG